MSVLIIGHSYVSMLEKELSQWCSNMFKLNLFSEDCDTSFCSARGGQIRQMESAIFNAVDRVSPKVVFLQLGGNDLDSEGTYPSTVINNLKQVALALTQRGVQRVIIAALFKRSQTRHMDPVIYNQLVTGINDHLAHYVQTSNLDGKVMFWEHRKLNGVLFSGTRCRDRVHLNHIGRKRYILIALRSLR